LIKGIEERVLNVARFIIDNNATIRQAEEVFGVSKTTIHKDMNKRLKEINYSMYEEVMEIIKTNKEERHLRGGTATFNRYCNKNGG